MASYHAPPNVATNKWRAGLFDCIGFRGKDRCAGGLPLCLCTVCAQPIPISRQVARAKLAKYSTVLVSLLLLTLIAVITGMSEGMWLIQHSEVVTDDEGIVEIRQTEDRPFWVILSSSVESVVSGFLLLFLVALRCTLVRRYHVNEDPIVSCLTATCCTGCSIAQQAMHVDLVEYGEVDQDCSVTGEHRLARQDHPMH